MPSARLSVAWLATLLASGACGGGSGPGQTATPPPAPVAAPPAPPRVVLNVARVRGTDLHFLERGAGTPVLLVHGSLGSLESWRLQIDSLATRFRVIAYSRRYHPPNQARAAGEPYALDVHADDLIALLEALQLERAHVVGSDYGAAVALLATLRRPDLVRSLVLAEPPILPWLARTPDGDSLRRAFEATALEPARRAFARGDSVDGVRRFLDGVHGRPGSYDALPERVRTALLHQAPELRLELRADPDAYMPAFSCRDVAAIRHSVLLVSGERSARLFRVITEELARCFRAEEIVTVPSAGHAMHADQPAFYNVAVTRFLLRN